MKRWILAGLCVAMLAGCGGQGSAERGNWLMALAAEESGKIPDPAERLTRQLNIADMQSGRGQKASASKTLVAAKETVWLAGDALPDRVAMAGYVSVSQLARRIGDTSLAASACENARVKLQAISPAQNRVTYVHAVAGEIRQLHGKAAAVFLREAGPWCKAIDDSIDRREAILILADALFRCDDKDGGLAMLQQEDDPAWRTDMLTAMAAARFREADFGKPLFSAAPPPSAYAAAEDNDGSTERASMGQIQYQRKSSHAKQSNLDYQRNFQGLQRPAE